jgi:hypothetical protein
MIRHHTSYQGLCCIFPAFPTPLPHRDQPTTLHPETDTKPKKSENLRAVVPDAVRFTLSYSAERYSDGVLADIDRLKAEGFEPIKIKNLWNADQYKGINSQWFTPETGTRFEMQFHTPESLEAKELTHEAYERIRANATLPVDEQDLAEEQALESFQGRVNALIATPLGTDRIKDFPEKSDG